MVGPSTSEYLDNEQAFIHICLLKLPLVLCIKTAILASSLNLETVALTYLSTSSSHAASVSSKFPRSMPEGSRICESLPTALAFEGMNRFYNFRDDANTFEVSPQHR